MGKRFPTPLIGVPTDEERYRIVVGLAAEPSSPLDRDDYRERCQGRLRKPETGEEYSSAYLKRILSSYAELGVVERKDGVILPSPFASEWLQESLDFSEFVWKSLKRSWVAMGQKPEGIEGLDRILRILEDESDGLERGEIEGRLSANYGYEFNEAGIRGYPEVLQLLSVIKKANGKYSISNPDRVGRYKRRFRNSDVFRTLETRLKREGAQVTPPRKSAKRDLVKYYMYREAGGWQKRRQWYKTFWRDYLKRETRDGDTKAELRRRQSYRDASSRREALRQDIKEQFPSFDSNSLAGLSTSVLNRISSAPTEERAHRIRISSGQGISKADLELLRDSTHESYTFPDGFSLYEWQREAADDWFAGGQNHDSEEGIAQVVTGAGKTVMALEVIRRWLEEASSDAVVSIVVPTRVLMRQWLSELVSKLNVPLNEIGWAGGGHKDTFEDCRIIVSIVNSAVQEDYLGNILEDIDSPSHLLVADECHRYTGDKFSNIFSYPRSASLGLSATPVTRGEDELTADDRMLLRELGEIYFELTYDEGIQRGLIPEFSINYIGFDLADPEQREYEELSRQVSDATKEIRQRFDHQLHELSGGFAQKLQILRNNTDGPTPAISDYFRYTQERRELVANAVARQAITLRLLRKAISTDQKTIVFQERIEQLEQLIAPWDHRGVNARTGEFVDEPNNYRARLYRKFDGLEKVDKEIEELYSNPDYWPVMYHSGHSRNVWNDIGMEWFREDGMANVMLSVKALIEGVDVPSADIGIVRVSSSSIRQRIQTLGRILRTGENASEESTLYVLYARNTVDERIFEEYDWQEELASAKVNHLVWAHNEEAGYPAGDLRPASPKEYPPRPEQPPDPNELSLGVEYEWSRDPIKQVSVNSQGKLYQETQYDRQYLDTKGFEEAIDFVLREKGGGRIIVNQYNHLLTVLGDGPVFLGTVDEPDPFEPKRGNCDQNDCKTPQENHGPESLTDEPTDEFPF